MFGKKKDPNNKARKHLYGKDGTLILYPNRVEHKVGLSSTELPLAEITSVTLESGEELSSRITATRLVALGVFALAAKKKTGGEKYVTIETGTNLVSVKVGRKDVNRATEFVHALELARKQLAQPV